jgi:hypothetical protein
MSIKLDTCPCCGGKAKMTVYTASAIVVCQNCKLSISRTDYFGDGQMIHDVVEAWNRRV